MVLIWIFGNANVRKFIIPVIKKSISLLLSQILPVVMKSVILILKGAIAPKDISIIRKPDRLGVRCCCLFEGFMDYLSYLTLVKLGRVTEGSEPMDYIVLNSVSTC